MDNLRLLKAVDTRAVIEEENWVIDSANCTLGTEILVGQDNARLMRTLQSRESKNGKLVASETPLGGVIEGSCGTQNKTNCHSGYAEIS